MTIFKSDKLEVEYNTYYPHKIEIDSLETFKNAVCRDHMGAECKGNKRKNENFIRSDCLMLDLDNDHSEEPADWKGINDIRAVFPDVQFYVCHSRNSGKVKNGKAARPKFHFYFPITEMTDADEYKRLKEAVMAVFPLFDAAAKDASRLFYGVDPPRCENVEGSSLLSDIIKPLPKDEPKPQAPPKPSHSTEEKNYSRLKLPSTASLSQLIGEFDLYGYVKEHSGAAETRSSRGGHEHCFDPCPVCGHNDHFFVNDETNLFHCKGTGRGGNILSYLAAVEGLTKNEARDQLKRLCGQDPAMERKNWKTDMLAKEKAVDCATDNKEHITHCQNDTPPEIKMQEKSTDNAKDSNRDLQPVEYNNDYIIVTYRDENKSKRAAIKSLWLEDGAPGQYLSEKSETVDENLSCLLKHYGLTLKYNVIKNRVEVWKDGKYIDRLENQLSFLADKALHQNLTVTPPRLEQMTVYTARTHKPYNPIKEYLETCEWDGADHIEELCGTLESPLDIKIMRSYIEKFLLQMVWLACLEATDTKHGPQFVLVLQGRQGMGKTSWFMSLLPDHLRAEYFLSGRHLDLSKKDDILEQSTVWLCELGEIASTFRKTDIEALKAYITALFDKVRPPYGKEAVELRRRMTLCGTSNDKEFLQDCTGNRRYAVIPCTSVNQFHSVNQDALWGQVYHEYKAGNDRYYFTEQEIKELTETNERFRVKSDIEIALLESYELWPLKEKTVSYMKLGDIADRLANKGFNNHKGIRTQINKILTANNCDHKKIDGYEVFRILEKI